MITCALAMLLAAAPGDAAFEKIEARYAREFLRRHPVVSTYLGGDGLDSALAEADGRLRDWSARALDEEAVLWRDVQKQLDGLDPAGLSSRRRIDREVMRHQIAFMLHAVERHSAQRTVDTYVNEPFRGVDWYMLGMTDAGGGRFGTEREWRTVAARVAAVPGYLDRAQANLAAGLAAGNSPDRRLVERDGMPSSLANAEYFEKALPDLAAARTQGQPFSAAVVQELRTRGAAAGRAYRALHDFMRDSLPRIPKTDRYALGEKEYDWALRNNLGVQTTAAELFASSWPQVETTRRALMDTAAEVAPLYLKTRGLPWNDADRPASTRAVIDVLAADYPKSDEEMTRWYHETSLRLVDYARRNGMFDIPADYKLEVVVTPPPLESSIDGAAYYPAPPFRSGGTGRFYVTPTHGDVEKLKQANRASIADLAAHEGFPGHDWNYKVLTRYRDVISPVRWLTPGEVEGSASMWEDSMSSEGWALYAEHLMSEPQPKEPAGFYTPEERIYELQGMLYRDLRVRVDTGLHTGRIGYDEAVDLFSEIVDFLPGSCRDAGATPVKKASCESSERAIFRYARWPTQAITYRLGKDRILALRARADAIAPGPEARRRFHEAFMREGTIPPDYFGDALIEELKGELKAPR